jgi:hypothetical protein
MIRSEIMALVDFPQPEQADLRIRDLGHKPANRGWTGIA